MLNQSVRVVEPKTIRGTLTLSHFVIMDSEAHKGKYATLATFYQVKPDDVGMLVARFRDDNPALNNVEICSKFSYVVCDFHHG
jgi:hypothetical protein